MSETTKPLDKYRNVTKFFVGFGTAATVGSVIRRLQPDDKITTKILFSLGAFGLGGAAVMASDRYTDQFFDELADMIDSFQEFRDEI